MCIIKESYPANHIVLKSENQNQTKWVPKRTSIDTSLATSCPPPPFSLFSHSVNRYMFKIVVRMCFKSYLYQFGNVIPTMHPPKFNFKSREQYNSSGYQDEIISMIIHNQHVQVALHIFFYIILNMGQIFLCMKMTELNHSSKSNSLTPANSQ